MLSRAHATEAKIAASGMTVERDMKGSLVKPMRNDKGWRVGSNLIYFSNPPGVHKTCSVGEIPDWTMINEIIDVIE